MAGITFGNSGYTLTGGLLTLGGGGVNTGSYNATINSTISGLNGLWKRGSGTLTLGGANTFSGYTNITGGTLTLANVNALAGSTLDYNSYGGLLSFGALTAATLGGLQGSQSLALTNGSAGVALTVGANDSTTTYTGILSGAGSLKKTGAGELTLTRANTYAGGTTIGGGTLTADFTVSSPTSILPSTTALTLAGGGLHAKFNSGNAQTVASTTINSGAFDRPGRHGGRRAAPQCDYAQRPRRHRRFLDRQQRHDRHHHGQFESDRRSADDPRRLRHGGRNRLGRQRHGHGEPQHHRPEQLQQRLRGRQGRGCSHRHFHAGRV